MTKQELKKSISLVAKNMLIKHDLRWQDIKFTNLPTVEVGEFTFFAQGEDADEIMKDCPDYINRRSYVLWYLNGAGAI